MAQPKTPIDKDPRSSFDVTCVIGTVVLDEDGIGDMPHVAAHKLIAEHDAEGVFKFPMSDGRTCAVTVEFTD